MNAPDIQNVSIRPCEGGAILAVKVVPGASRDKVVGVLGDCLKIATCAPPEKGKANAAVAQILARFLKVDKRDVELVSGPANPRKEFRVAGLSVEELRSRLGRG